MWLGLAWRYLAARPAPLLANAANALATWYGGSYNGLAHKRYLDYRKGREAEHLVIECCKAHPDERIIHAVGVVLKDMHAENGHRDEVSAGALVQGGHPG